ncbi:hypothetical protein MVEN_00863400 [Mycena venus]|uniref:Uncharacterized protein n=1 Tax=Mycena venus TaxID=2733690 RepID=A0A8H7D3L3_9AGAR|nr:hypothetical protein MVEN_00863400 [Mycena venus]
MSAVVTGNLVAALLELFFYGSYFVLLTTVIYLFRRRHGIPPKNAPAALLLLGLVIQFLVITVHSANTTYQTVFAIHLGGGAATEAFYLNLTRPSFVANMTLMVITHHLTDAFVLHRLHVIFSRGRNVMIFPLICFLAQIVSGCGVIYRSATSNLDEDYLTLSNGWLTAKLVASIFDFQDQHLQFRGHILENMADPSCTPKNSLLAILVESAVLQTATAIGMLASFQYKWGAGEFIWTGIAPAIFGISTVLIHARIGLGWAHDSERSPPVNVKPTRVQVSANANDEERMLETTSGFKLSGMLRGPRTPTKMYILDV